MPPPRYPIARKDISAAVPVRRGEGIAAGSALPAHLAFLRQRGAPAPLPAGAVLPLGDTRLDACLPQGGLALGALHELASDGVGAETCVLPAAFAALLAGRLPGRAPVLWVARRDDLYAPGLLRLGPGALDPARLVLARADDDAAVLGGMETALRAGGLAAVIGEVGGWGQKEGQSGGRIATRRLQLACQAKGITAFALRRWPFGGAAEDREASAASTRWHLAPAPSARGMVTRWRLELRHARGGRPGTWMVEVNDDATDPAANNTAAPVVRVVAALADHAAAAGADFRQAAGYG